MNHSTNNTIAYVGPAGAGLGFQLAGLTAYDVEGTEETMRLLRSLKQEGAVRIIFVDEGLVGDQLETLAKLNEDPLPAIILLPNPVEAKNLAAQNLQQLMVRAVGSDIFG